MRDRGLRFWLPDYIAGAPGRFLRRRSRGTRHILFLVCDHFEPRHGITREGQEQERMARWDSEYPKFRERCRSAFGHAPRHTWFYPPHHGLEHLETLARWAFEGRGEVELHYHHGNDTSESLRQGLKDTLAAYARRGLLLKPGGTPVTSFAFIHGDWALDNSGEARHCGVNDELTILQELGCWGDFTMPSANECQTRQINSIYYAEDDPKRPKSHDRGRVARAGFPPGKGLFLMQGPLGINWHGPRYPRFENASLTTPNWGRPDRIQSWLECHVHVRGRPEWTFVKLHAHGAVERDHDALFGDRAFELQKVLNEKYNDGDRYRLHYVTAREAFNVARAAERGADGDPSRYLDSELPPYVASRYWLDAEHDLARCDEGGLFLAGIAGPGGRRLKLKLSAAAAEIRGAMKAVAYEVASGTLDIELAHPGRVDLTLPEKWRVEDLDGGGGGGLPLSGERARWRLKVSPC